MGKGSSPRPMSVPKDVFDAHYENIFRKDRRAEEDAKAEDEAFDEIAKRTNEDNSN